MKNKFAPAVILVSILLASCAPSQSISPAPQAGRPRVLASTSFLADIAQNVAGNRFVVEPLLPLGVDPHAYQPKPADAARVAASTVLILNGADYEQFIQPLLENVGGDRLVVEASAGLTPRLSSADDEHTAGDPHFWLDPSLVITYVENIRNGFIAADPEGAEIYTANADAYIMQLQELDTWIQSQVDT